MAKRVLNFDALANSALLKSKEVAAWLGVADSTVWDWSNSGKLAKPIKLGEAATRWRAGDVRAFIERQAGGVL